MPALARIAHSLLWQKLPRRWRRAALERGAAFLAPRADAAPRPGGSVTVAGVLRASSGLGQSARSCLSALQALGEQTQGADVSDIFIPDGGSVAWDEDIVRSAAGPGIVIVHVNAPLLPLALLRIGRAALERKVVIGYWAWELPAVPLSWQRGMSFVHEIWVPSDFVANALRPIADGKPIRVVPHPVALEAEQLTGSRPAEAGKAFTVLTMFDMASSFARKNPLGAVETFRRAFGDETGVRLIVKYQHPEVCPEGWAQLQASVAGARNIVLDGRTLQREGVAALIGSADVFLSLHRSEGFGLGLAEAMAAGVPVIATNWSGNVDFLGPEEGRPIGYRFVPARDQQGEYDHPDQFWAEPDIGEAVEALALLRDDPALRVRLGQAARARVMRELTADGYARALAACRARFA